MTSRGAGGALAGRPTAPSPQGVDFNWRIKSVRPILPDRIPYGVEIEERVSKSKNGKNTIHRIVHQCCATCGKPIERALKWYRPAVPWYCSPRHMWDRNKLRNEHIAAVVVRVKPASHPRRHVAVTLPSPARYSNKLDLDVARVEEVAYPTECGKCRTVLTPGSIVVRDPRVAHCQDCYFQQVESIHGTGTGIRSLQEKSS